MREEIRSIIKESPAYRKAEAAVVDAKIVREQAAQEAILASPRAMELYAKIKLTNAVR